MILTDAYCESSAQHVTNEVEFVLRYTPTIRKAAQRALIVKGYVDLDDLIQEAWIHVLPRWEKLHENGEEKLVYTDALLFLKKYMKKELADYDYFSGKFVYTPEIVKTQLEIGAWESDPQGDWDIRLDVMAAFDELNPERQWMLEQAYRLGISPHSKEFEGSYRTVDKALQQMADYLNKRSTSFASPEDRAAIGV